MATVRFSIFPDATEAQIVQAVGAATVTSNIELTVDLGNTMDGTSRVIQKEEVLLALERLADFIMKGGVNLTGWPPQ
jgi:hypothetical protein